MGKDVTCYGCHKEVEDENHPPFMQKYTGDKDKSCLKFCEDCRRKLGLLDVKRPSC